jgi:HSP20 family molecular chaperone IbpA
MALLFNTFSNKIFDDIINDTFVSQDQYKKLNTNNRNQFEAEILEDGKQQVIINTTGHNPKDISVKVTEDNIQVKSEVENASKFVENIDLTLTLGKDYDGTKSSASFENGLLTLLIDKKETKKGKTLKITY